MNQRTIADPLPDGVTEYLETKVEPVLATLKQIEFQVKDAKNLEKAKELFETLKTQAADQMDGHDAIAIQLAAIQDNGTAERAYTAVSEKESAMQDLLTRLGPLLNDLMKGGRRLKTRKGRRVTKATRRGRHGRS
jgi:hypothetical protein